MCDLDYEKYKKANEAIRDILFMYRELINYSGLFDDFGTEDGLFNPSIYVDCSTKELSIHEDDAKLLHEGSAIKLICSVFQAWGQEGYPERDCQSVIVAKNLLEKGRLKHIPELEGVLKISLVSYDKANEFSNEIYKKYVLGYFKKLISA